MPDAANALQQGIYAALVADAALAARIGANGIFDHRASGRPMPYLVIAGLVTTDAGPDMEEHILTIEAWSDAPGRREVQTIAAAVQVRLDDAALTLAGATLVSLQHRQTRVRREPKTRAFVAELTLRAVTE
jgi:hypothetical protein